MLDITEYKELVNTYSGSEKKKKMLINGSEYLVKFPDPVRESNNALSYMNNQFSEYIGCHIFETFNIPVQETDLCKYHDKNKEKICVICKDIGGKDKDLVDFLTLANSITDNDKKFKNDIEDIYYVLDRLPVVFDKEKTLNQFWDMVVVDYLIANYDRHSENWGFLKKDEVLEISPVYDCGSCLYPLFSDERISELFQDKNICMNINSVMDDALYSNKTELKNISINIRCPFQLNGKKLTYTELLNSNLDDLNKAILRIVPRIDIDKINSIIDQTPIISIERKRLCKETIRIRKVNVLDKLYRKILKNKSVEQSVSIRKKIEAAHLIQETNRKKEKKNEIHTEKKGYER